MNKNLLTTIAEKLMYFCSWNLFKIVCKGEIHNLEYLDELKGTSFIVTPNHTSHLDWLVIYSLFKRKFNQKITFLAKKELFEHVLWKYVAIGGGAIKLDRENVTKDVLKSIYTSIRNKWIVGIFPEGTRSKNGKLLKAKPGAIKLAMSTGLPIVPIGLCGFNEVLPSGALFPVPHKCVINIGKPIYIKQDHADKSVEEITVMVMKEIAALSNQEYDYSEDSVPFSLV
ncbi:MAG: 1-acyl-sn-glycerol-3-phosphate acyltransferase [Clostridia bacterium]|nr:1-acyl-sn-glycerol-3-phosphate acyltransferase [Clostridia bacterium]